jgi:hypothetical protein
MLTGSQIVSSSRRAGAGQEMPPARSYFNEREYSPDLTGKETTPRGSAAVVLPRVTVKVRPSAREIVAPSGAKLKYPEMSCGRLPSHPDARRTR